MNLQKSKELEEIEQSQRHFNFEMKQMMRKEKLLEKEEQKLDQLQEYSSIVRHNRYMAKKTHLQNQEEKEAMIKQKIFQKEETLLNSLKKVQSNLDQKRSSLQQLSTQRLESAK